VAVAARWNYWFPLQQMTQIADLVYNGVKEESETRHVGTTHFHFWPFFAVCLLVLEYRDDESFARAKGTRTFQEV
jgi:hypothetical protein